MHVLVIPSWYMTRYNPLRGIFFYDQAKATARLCRKVAAIYVYQIGWKARFKQRSFAIGRLDCSEAGPFENTVYELPTIPRLPKLNRFLKYGFWKFLIIRHILLNGKPDVVHLHSFFEGSIAIWLNKRLGINYVVTEHSSAIVRELLSDEELAFASEVYSRSSLNIAVSEELCAQLKKRLNRDFLYLPNFIDVNEFRPSAGHSDGNEVFTFLSIGFLTDQKNHRMLIEAFFREFAGEEHFRLLIAGDGPEYDALMEQIRGLGLEKRVRLLGRLSRTDIVSVIQEADCFVLPSKYETFGVVLVEALSCGVPVIATRCGGPESIVLDDRIGSLCDISADDLAKKMRRWSQREIQSGFIREYAIRHFSDSVVVEKLLSLYSTAAERRHGVD